MVEENFELECSEKLQNEGFYNCFWVNSFTTVYENFEFECSEMLQNDGTSNSSRVSTFTMVNRSFEFEYSEMLQNEGILILTENTFHHGWRKFWIWML